MLPVPPLISQHGIVGEFVRTSSTSHAVTVAIGVDPKAGKTQALSAGAFVVNSGVNTHMGYYGTAYTNDVPKVISLLEGLGIGVVRDGEATGHSDICAEDAKLGAAGITFDFVTNVNSPPGDATKWAECVGPRYVKSFEGPNEYDISHGSDPHWAASDRARQIALYHEIRSKFGDMGVIAPSVTTVGAARELGNLSNVATAGNAHVYFDGLRNPGTPPYGDLGYGSIDYDVAVDSAVNGSLPIITTETGFVAGPTGVSLATQAKYVVRNLLLLAQHGSSSYYYELLDDHVDRFSPSSLVDAAYHPKPSYDAMKSLLGLLADGGDASARGKLGFAISGPTDNVRSVLFQKRNGTFYLAIWIESPSALVDKGTDIAVPAQRISLELERPMTATCYHYDAAWRLVPTSLGKKASLPLTVTDSVEVVALR